MSVRRSFDKVVVFGEVSTKFSTKLDQEPRTKEQQVRTKEKEPSTEAEYSMPRDIMSSEPTHWAVFGQLVMPVQCCAEAPAAAAAPQHSTAQA